MPMAAATTTAAAAATTTTTTATTTTTTTRYGASALPSKLAATNNFFFFYLGPLVPIPASPTYLWILALSAGHSLELFDRRSTSCLGCYLGVYSLPGPWLCLCAHPCRVMSLPVSPGIELAPFRSFARSKAVRTCTTGTARLSRLSYAGREKKKKSIQSHLHLIEKLKRLVCIETPMFLSTHVSCIANSKVSDNSRPTVFARDYLRSPLLNLGS
jgi:hypothetical protein